jgi:hypothetical protein
MPLQGSRYKFAEMFGRYCDLVPVESIDHKDGARYDFAIVRGDRSSDFRQAQRAGLPYILIEHDVWSVRAGRKRDDTEEQMLQGATCIIFTSAHHIDLAQRYEDLPLSFDVALRPLASDLDFEPLPKLPGQNLVYAGGLAQSGSKGKFGYRDYRSIFERLMAVGWTVHVYPAWGGVKHAEAYEAIGCVFHDPVPQTELYRELSQYQAGFQGYAKHGSQVYVKSCRPNKLWEYQAAGIPTFGYNTGTGSDVYEGKWGFVAKTFKDFGRVSKKVLALQISEEMRVSEVMDADEEIFVQMVSAMSDAEPPVRRRTHYRLGKKIEEFEGRTYHRGERITRAVAMRMLEAGVIQGKGL